MSVGGMLMYRHLFLCINILCGGDGGGGGGGGGFIAETMIDMVKICRSISHQ